MFRVRLFNTELEFSPEDFCRTVEWDHSQDIIDLIAMALDTEPRQWIQEELLELLTAWKEELEE